MNGWNTEKFLTGFLPYGANIGKILFVVVIILFVLRGISCQPSTRNFLGIERDAQPKISQQEQKFGGCALTKNYYIKQ